VTAYDRYALRAFDANAADYLLKPVGQERFARALARAKERIAEKPNREATERLIALLGRIAARDETLERLAVAENGRILFVKTSEIDWIEADGNHARVHAGARKYQIRETLSNLERKLNPRDFCEFTARPSSTCTASRKSIPGFTGITWCCWRMAKSCG